MNSISWQDFLEKIKTFKMSGVKIGLNAPSVIRLLYGGAFDSMLPKEMFDIPAAQRYAQLTRELLAALGSRAKIPTKNISETIGICDINSTPRLMLWRHSVNPFAQYEMSEYYIDFLKTRGFSRPTEADRRDDPGLLWVRYPNENTNHKIRVDMRRSWNGIFYPSIYRKYEYGNRLIGVIGVVIKAQKRLYQETKESLSIVLFNGHEYTHDIKMWPKQDGKLDRGTLAQIAELSMGLAIVRPKFWNNRPTANLISWDKIWGN